MKKAIILFVRHPELGKVKTRLAKDIGDEKALLVYKRLLQHTHDITVDLPYDKFVFYTDAAVITDVWEPHKYFKQVQSGNDLGERMQNAFNTLFAKGYEKVVIIGSDCPELSPSLIDKAFETLSRVEVVFGPAADGGYYLLGLTGMIGKLFENKEWSTGSVLTDSLEDLSAKKISHSLLPVLRDVDCKEDLADLNF